MKYIICTFLFLIEFAPLWGIVGGTSQDDAIDIPVAESSVGNEINVKIEPIRNVTGKKAYDELCHYTHLKLAQILDSGGKYAVVSDELTSEVSGLEFLKDLPSINPTTIISVELLDVEESDGATIRIGFFTSQKRYASVKLRVKFIDLYTSKITTKTGTGKSAKGSWGVIAQVNRDKMLEGEGFWELDNSMLGIAITKALLEAVEDF
jgi:hypothetical protein